MKTSKQNTFLFTLYVVFLVLYGAAEEINVLGWQGICLWTTMLLILVSAFKKNGKELSKAVLYFVAYILCFLIITITTSGSLMTMFLFVASVLLMYLTPYMEIDTRKLTRILYVFFLILTIIALPDLVISLTAMAERELPAGIFLSSNNYGFFTAVVLSCTLLFEKNNKIKILFSIICAIIILACKSRGVFACMAAVLLLYFIPWKKKWVPIIVTMGIFVFYMVFLLIIEPGRGASDAIDVFGKGASSSGRDLQIYYTVAKFPILAFGNGYHAVDEYIAGIMGLVLHNTWVNTLYAFGYVYVILFCFFIYKYIIKKLQSKLAISFLMGFQIFSLFEPGVLFFPAQVPTLALVLVSMKIIEERRIKEKA